MGAEDHTGRRSQHLAARARHPEQRPGMPTLVFVAGLHRSGTSFVSRCIGRHPRIGSIQGSGVPEDEGQHVQSVYPPASAFGGPGRFAFAAEMHLTETSRLATRENAARVWREWSRYWDPSRPYFLEKSPPNLLKSRLLQSLFPGSRFVVILRHPLAVAFATQKWSRTSLASLLEHWLVAHERFELDRPHLEHALVLRYEQFMRQPEATLSRVHEFIGVKPSKGRIVVKRRVNESYFARWHAARKRWFGRYRAGILVDRYEHRINRYGYSLVDLDRFAGPGEPAAAAE